MQSIITFMIKATGILFSSAVFEVINNIEEYCVLWYGKLTVQCALIQVSKKDIYRHSGSGYSVNCFYVQKRFTLTYLIRCCVLHVRVFFVL